MTSKNILLSAVTDNSHSVELSKCLWDNGSYKVLQICIVVHMFYMIVEVCNATSHKIVKYITVFFYIYYDIFLLIHHLINSGGCNSHLIIVYKIEYILQSFFSWLGRWLVTSKILPDIINAYLTWRQINGFFVYILISFIRKWRIDWYDIKIFSNAIWTLHMSCKDSHKYTEKMEGEILVPSCDIL